MRGHCSGASLGRRRSPKRAATSDPCRRLVPARQESTPRRRGAERRLPTLGSPRAHTWAGTSRAVPVRPSNRSPSRRMGVLRHSMRCRSRFRSFRPPKTSTRSQAHRHRDPVQRRRPPHPRGALRRLGCSNRRSSASAQHIFLPRHTSGSPWCIRRPQEPGSQTGRRPRCRIRRQQRVAPHRSRHRRFRRQQ